MLFPFHLISSLIFRILESYVHEFLVSDDHEHYTSSEPLEIHSDMDMEYDSFEQKPKKSNVQIF